MLLTRLGAGLRRPGNLARTCSAASTRGPGVTFTTDRGDRDKRDRERAYPKLPQVTVGVVVLKEDELGGVPRAMLVERKNDPAKNTFAFPGGRLNLGESLQDCARREVREESNVELCASFPLELVTTIEHVSRDDEGDVKFHYVIVEFVGLAAKGSREIPGDDAASIDWASLDELWDKNILDKKAHEDVMRKALEIYRERRNP